MNPAPSGELLQKHFFSNFLKKKIKSADISADIMQGIEFVNYDAISDLRKR